MNIGMVKTNNFAYLTHVFGSKPIIYKNTSNVFLIISEAINGLFCTQ